MVMWNRGFSVVESVFLGFQQPGGEMEHRAGFSFLFSFSLPFFLTAIKRLDIGLAHGAVVGKSFDPKGVK